MILEIVQINTHKKLNSMRIQEPSIEKPDSPVKSQKGG